MHKKDKIFRDTIYGYISIPVDFCKEFIDNEFFQRLRRIEQTSMRVLYPTAHHDRFAHSVGVYHLGRLAFQKLKQNSKDFYKNEITEDDWNKYQKSFEIACLLHDIGHSPFSHTFEHYFLYKKEKEILERFKPFFKSEHKFNKEYENSGSSPHEKISALILLEKFSEKIKSHGGDPLLAARMIMGCTYESRDFKNKFKNRIIRLLNGNSIDVDSLDYIQRDTWSSGVSNVVIDFERLLSSIIIKNDESDIPRIVFKKQVLSVLENIVIGRNFLYKWIYSHHKVVYEQELLKKAIEEINDSTNGEFCKNLFSLDSIYCKQSCSDFSFFLPTDDDIFYTFKNYFNQILPVKELLSRNYSKKAIWKTYFEFESIFEKTNLDERLSIFGKINDGILKEQYDPIALEVKPKLKGLNNSDFFIDIDGTLKDASTVIGVKSENLHYFLLYVSEDLFNKKDEIIQEVKSLQS